MCPGKEEKVRRKNLSFGVCDFVATAGLMLFKSLHHLRDISDPKSQAQQNMVKRDMRGIEERRKEKRERGGGHK